MNVCGLLLFCASFASSDSDDDDLDDETVALDYAPAVETNEDEEGGGE